jgi:outer membrane receptor protein involved in Fe transport
MKLYILTLIVLFNLSSVLALETDEIVASDTYIKGRVVDSQNSKPVEYATVALYNTEDNKVVTGTVTKANGSFKISGLKEGSYYLIISFIGYEEKRIEKVVVTAENKGINLSEIVLQRSTQKIDEVEVVANSASVQYKIDKKVVNVSKQFAATAGTAVDVLESVPSVRVDIEGNISLRGSSGFTVLIDGRPTILDANDALRQIPASTIENIEIITNPSVKYEPDGTAGIINIISKKNRLKGISGITNFNYGLDEKYGGDFLFSLKGEKVNFFIGGNYNYREYPGGRITERVTSSVDTTWNVYSEGSTIRKSLYKGLKGGIELDLSKKDFLSFSYSIGEGERKWESYLDYTDWSVPGGDINSYKSIENGFRGGTYQSLSTDFQHKFDDKGHEILANFTYQKRDMDESSKSELRDDENETVFEGRESTEKGPSERMQLKLDYTLPLGENDKFEAGFQGRKGESNDFTELRLFDNESGNYISQPQYEHKTVYFRNIYSLYSLYAGMRGRFGYQGGLRGEYVWREIESDVSDEESVINGLDLFPTLHLSYNLPAEWQMMGSYSRRIERPRSYYLEPFLTWMDAYNVRKGNPNLNPEYIDSYELGILKTMGNNFLSGEAFYRVTHNKVERVRSVFDKDVFLHSIENVGNDYSLGVELALKYNVIKWWQVDLSGSLYNYRVEGVLGGADFSRTSFNWNTRMNNTLMLGKTTQLQLNGRYNSETATAQGRTEGYFTADASLRKYFLKKKLYFTLQGRDLFQTATRKYTSVGDDFYYYSESYYKAPVVILTITFNFNNYKVKRQGRGDGGDGEGEEF